MGDFGLFGLPFPRSTAGRAARTSTCASRSSSSAESTSRVAITLEAGVGLGMMPILHAGTEEQKQQWLPAARERQGARRVRAHRAGGRVGRRCHEDHRRARGRRVGHQRHEAIHHQLGHGHHQARDDHRRDRAAMPTAQDRAQRHPAAERHAGLRGRARVRQGRLERLRHASAVLLRRARARGQPARRARPRVTRTSCGCSTRDASRSRRSLPGPPRAASSRPPTTRKQRIVFGRPIGANQHIAFLLARMQVRTHAARLATYDAAQRDGRRAAVQDRGEHREAASRARPRWTTRATRRRSSAATGFMNEYPVARHYRDSKILEIGEGTTEVQLMVISRELGL